MEFKLLVLKAKEGDKDALVQLIMAKKEDYYKLAYTYVKNREDALDVIEDMILILFKNIYKLKEEEAFYSWSKTILVNSCKKYLKNKKKVISMENIKEEFYEDGIKQNEDKIIFEKYFLKLSKKHQEVIKLRYYLDYEYETIARILKIPVGTVKSRIFNGLNKLKENFGGEEL